MTDYFERYRDIIDDWEAFRDALSRPLPTCGWSNRLKCSRDQLLRRFSDDGIEASPIEWHPDAFILGDEVHPGRRMEHIAGLFQVQEEAALGAVRFLDLQSGDRVLDMCAAPGNKTAQICIELENTGTVVANDRSYHRLRAVRNTADRLGIVNMVVTEYDAGNLPSDIGRFDAVLADVPCSCTGTSRKNPSVLDDPDQSIESLANTQRAILYKAFQLTRPGGRVVYSTCSYAPEENESVVQDILDRLDYEPRWVECRIPGFRAAPGLTEWQGEAFSPEMSRAMRVWPHHNDTGGFFVAAFEIPEKA